VRFGVDAGGLVDPVVPGDPISGFRFRDEVRGEMRGEGGSQ